MKRIKFKHGQGCYANPYTPCKVSKTIKIEGGSSNKSSLKGVAMKHLALAVLFCAGFCLLSADSQSWFWFVASKLAGGACMLALVFAVNSMKWED